MLRRVYYFMFLIPNMFSNTYKLLMLNSLAYNLNEKELISNIWVIKKLLLIWWLFELYTHLVWFKGALYIIWCGVNRLGDSGVKWCE